MKFSDLKIVASAMCNFTFYYTTFQKNMGYTYDYGHLPWLLTEFTILPANYFTTSRVVHLAAFCDALLLENDTKVDNKLLARFRYFLGNY